MFDFLKRSSKKEPEVSISNIATLVREGDNLLSDSLILLDEQLSGNLFCAEEIVVEQNGILSGNMTAKRCVVSGTINGDIVSTHQMEIKSTAVIRGNIKCAAINIEPGAVINGKVIIAADNKAAAKLMERINNHSADEYQSAKLAAETTEDSGAVETQLIVTREPELVSLNQLQDKPVSILHEEPPVVIEPFIAQKAVVAPEEIVQQVPVTTPEASIEQPPAITPEAPVQKPLIAPTPKAQDKPSEESANRWW